MAGQKPYSTNFLTSGRNAVCCTVSLTLDTSKASGGATLVNGKYMGLSNANGNLTVTFPEKFAKCEWLDSQIVDTGKTGNQMVTSVDYSPTTGQATFSLISPSQAAITTGVFKVYVQAIFILG